MVTPEKRLLEFVARVVYNIPELPGRLKLYYSQFLAFHFSRKLSLSQIQDIENKKASKAYANQNAIMEAAKEFSLEDKIWILGSLKLLHAEAESIDDRVTSRKINALIKEFTITLELQDETEKILTQQSILDEEFHQFQNRPIVKIPTELWPLSLDFLLRWTLMLCFSAFGFDKDYLPIYNIFLIPILILGLAYFVGRYYWKNNYNLLQNYGGPEKFTIVYGVTTNQYTWLAIYLGTGIFISYLLPDQLHLLTLAGLTIYYFIYLRSFRIGRLKENELVKQLEQDNLNTENLTVDENDEVIVSLETKLNSSTSRLEAYVLESALFGALSFSGFLQIMATELISFKDLEGFASYIYSTSQAFINLDWTAFNDGLAGLSSKKSLFCLISVESLICSIFFLAVIASRLRFSDIADRIRTAINMAKAYNEKEESLHDEQEISGKKITRLDALTAKVNAQLHDANHILGEIKPVMTYMEYFRNAGILVFVIILISSSLFITGALGWIFIAMVVATYLYFNRMAINETMKSFILNFRIQFMQWSTWLFLLSVAPYFIAYILKIFFHVHSGALFPICTMLVCFYTSIWLVLAAHVDEKFGEIEMNQTRLKRWRLVKNTVALLVILFGLALTFKMLWLMGANEMLFISLISLALSMYFVGYYLSKIRLVGIVSGGILAVSCMGALFKFLHLSGGNQMALIATMLLPILIAFILLRRNLFHQLFLRFCITSFVIGLWFGPVAYGFKRPLMIAYENETANADEITKINTAIEVNLFSDHLFRDITDDMIEKGIAESNWYLNEYGTRLGFTQIHDTMVREYAEFAYEVVGSDFIKDSVIVSFALKLVRQELKILELFEFKDFIANTDRLKIEADLLMALGRRDEAIASLRRIINYKIAGDIKVELMNYIRELESKP